MVSYAFTDIDGENPFGTSRGDISPGNAVAWEAAGGAVNERQITFPPNDGTMIDTYMIMWYIIGPNAATCVKPGLVPGVAVNLINMWAGVGETWSATSASTTGTNTRYLMMFGVNIYPGEADSEARTLTFDDAGIYPNGSGTTGNLTIVRGLGYADE